MNILVIEDDKGILDYLESSFKEEGFVVDVASDGNIGLYKASTNNYDIVILDLYLPKKDGRTICSEIRAAGNSVPIIILSVRGEVENKVELLKIGADDFLSKPFYFNELLARVNALLRRPRKMENTVFEIDGLTIDIDNHKVTRDGNEAHLALKEFLLLEYLVRNRGKVLSRTELLEHVWDVNADPFTNTVETHIMNLRKKLGCRERKELIKTVPGVGYKID